MNSAVKETLSGGKTCSLENEADLRSKKPSSYAASFTGFTTVFNLFLGEVLYLGTNNKLTTITVKVSPYEIIRYGNFVSTYVSLNSSIKRGTRLGIVDSNKGLKVQYCTKSPYTSSYPIRVNNVIYYQQNPMGILDGTYTPSQKTTYTEWVECSPLYTFTEEQSTEWTVQSDSTLNIDKNASQITNMSNVSQDTYDMLSNNEGASVLPTKSTSGSSTFTNSGLVSYTKISPSKTSNRTHPIDTISIHCMAGQLSVETCGDVFQNRAASANYGIGPDGRIGMYVEEKDRSWCTSNAANDHRAVTIEVASDSTHPYAVKDAAYQSLITLLVDICQRNNIKELKWKGDKRYIGQVSKQNMTVHRWFSSKACPGDYLYKKHGAIAKAVNERIGTDTPVTPLGGISSAAATNGTYIYSEIAITSPNSTLVSLVSRLSTESSSVRSGAVEGITVHIAKATGTIEELSEMVASSDRSYNYGIDTNGDIGLFADEPILTNGTGNADNDDRVINIVCMNSNTSSDYPMSTATYDSLVELCADICKRNYIPALTYTNKPKKDTLTLHSQFEKKSGCPGPWFTKKISTFVSDVNTDLARMWSQDEARIAESDEAALFIQSSINIDSIKPYVVCPSKTALNVDYKSMRDFGVVGVMLDAGMRYNTKHELTTYRNANLYNQVAEVATAKLPYGFFYTTHARNIAEVKEETYWLYFIITKYPPKLGIWLHLDLDVGAAAAQAIVEKYYATFVDWGLKSKCGLYATKAQAKLIEWPKQCTYMPLWLEGEMSDNVSPDEELLTPSFFKLDDLTNSGYKEGQEVSAPSTIAKSYIGESEESNTYNLSGGGTINYGNYTEVKVPNTKTYKGFKSYESFRAITSKTSNQYKILNDPQCQVDSDGFKRIDGRYMIAVGTGVSSTTGTYLDVVLENGTVIQAIVGDIKADVHTDAATGHIITTHSQCCSEFIVDIPSMTSEAGQLVRKMGNCSYLNSSWNSKVAKFKVYKTNWFNKE